MKHYVELRVDEASAEYFDTSSSKTGITLFGAYYLSLLLRGRSCAFCPQLRSINISEADLPYNHSGACTIVPTHASDNSGEDLSDEDDYIEGPPRRMMPGSLYPYYDDEDEDVGDGSGSEAEVERLLEEEEDEEEQGGETTMEGLVRWFRKLPKRGAGENEA